MMCGEALLRSGFAAPRAASGSWFRTCCAGASGFGATSQHLVEVYLNS